MNIQRGMNGLTTLAGSDGNLRPSLEIVQCSRPNLASSWAPPESQPQKNSYQLSLQLHYPLFWALLSDFLDPLYFLQSSNLYSPPQGERLHPLANRFRIYKPVSFARFCTDLSLQKACRRPFIY